MFGFRSKAKLQEIFLTLSGQADVFIDAYDSPNDSEKGMKTAVAVSTTV